MKFFLKIFPLAAVILLSASCTKKPAVENTPTYKMAGEWYIKYYTGGSEITDYHRLISYNTSDPNSNQVWVDDLGTWPFRAKFNINYTNLAFTSVASTPNLEVSGETVKVLEGKVFPLQGRSKTGVVVDSIYLKLEFSDDPGTVYEIKGHHKTGFFEDDY